MSTYKNTNNCLLFFSANFFLDSINSIFQFRFVESKDNKWVLEFCPVGEIIWQRKPISICLKTNHIEFNKETGYYLIVPNEHNIEEDVQLLKAYSTLHDLLVQAINNPELNQSATKISVSDLKLWAPYHFDHSKFPTWLNQPGQTTLRISNAACKDNYANILLAFNNWKYIQLAKRESNKKRKLEVESLPESIPTEIVESQKAEIMEAEN
jgi:hypothetical protein